MPTRSLPDQPSLEHLRHQARALQRAAQAGDATALARIAAHHKGSRTLSAAQLVIAREYGFASWPRLRHHLELLQHFRRDPDATGRGDEDLADRFCRLACLTYGDDGPARWAQARELVAAHPDLPGRSIWAAAAASDPEALQRHLAAGAGSANREGGPHRWVPLAYLTFSRLDSGVAPERVLAAAGVLLDAGADPNAGYLWHGLPTPFTVLTGAFGEGEAGPDRQPRHPHWLALSRRLLQAGADPNDGQGLYNRMFGGSDEHLDLLFAFGLGTGTGGPWRARLGAAVDSPAELLRRQLHWAISRHYPDRVRLLAEHGVDLSNPLADGHTPAELAALAGDPGVVQLLLDHGAAPPALSPVDELAGAALAGDRDAVDRLLSGHPGLAEQARRDRPTLILFAAEARRPDAVAILGGLGFDPSAGARPGDGRVLDSTALHYAAANGDVALVRQLLDLGADRDRLDQAHNSTPAGWAKYFGHEDVVELLTA